VQICRCNHNPAKNYSIIIGGCQVKQILHVHGRPDRLVCRFLGYRFRVLRIGKWSELDKRSNLCYSLVVFYLDLDKTDTITRHHKKALSFI